MHQLPDLLQKHSQLFDSSQKYFVQENGKYDSARWLGEKRRAKEEASTSSCRPSGYRCGRSQSRGQGELSVDGLSVLIKVMPGQERKKLSHNTVRLHTRKGLDRGFGEGICPRCELWRCPGALPKRERRTLGEKVTLLLGRASLRTGVDHQPYGSFASQNWSRPSVPSRSSGAQLRLLTGQRPAQRRRITSRSGRLWSTVADTQDDNARASVVLACIVFYPSRTIAG